MVNIAGYDLGYAARPAPGAMFDEHSVSWRTVNRWSVLAGGGAALLAQVGHPSVAAGVAQHSSYATDPFARLERTLTSMLAISFGSPERREAVLAQLRGVHRQVTGQRADGEHYRALDPELQLWVWATLIDTALKVERRYIGELNGRDREQFYAEASLIAEEFRIPADLIPADLAAFDDYVADTMASLVVTDAARDVCREVMRPQVRFVPGGVWLPLEWVTVDLLPRSVSRAYGLAPLRRPQKLALGGVRKVTRAVLPRFPDVLLGNPLTKAAIGA